MDRDREHLPAARRRRLFLGTLLALATLALLLGCIMVFPHYLVAADTGTAQLPAIEAAKARNDVRGTLLQGLGGLVLIVTAYFTWQRMKLDKLTADSKLDHDRDAATTQRFTQAVGQLGEDKTAVRLGGIHALARIAEAPAADVRDKKAVLEILAALVRTGSTGLTPPDAVVTDIPHLPVRAPDIQDALTTITRIAPERPYTNKGWWVVNLMGADLRRAWLSGANLRRFGLRNVNFEKASLDGADLRGAELRGTNIHLANLEGALADATTWWPEHFDPAAAGVRLVPVEADLDLSECFTPGIREAA
jgi:hypothetical protein